MRKRIVLNSPRILELKRKKHQALRKKIFLIFSTIIIVLLVSTFLFRWQKINITNIQITGNKVIESEKIQDLIKEKISGDYLWFFPKTNFLLYPRGEIIADLVSNYKRIKDISVGVKNLNTLDISMTERTGLFTYCGERPEDSSDSLSQKCYFIDADGYIFDEAPYFSGAVYLKFYGKTDNEEDPSGSYFFEPIFKKLITFKDTLEKIGVKPVAFYIDENDDISILLQPVGVDQPKIILKSDADFEKVAENLQSVLTTEPLKTDFKNKYSSLLYIDLRFGNKVYYKFK